MPLPIDLGQIVVSRPPIPQQFQNFDQSITPPMPLLDILNMAKQPTQQPMQPPIPQSIQPPIQQMPQVPPSTPQGGNIPEGILQFLPALIALTAGMASPNALPGAAGFMGGYAGGLGKAKEQELEKRKVDILEKKSNKPKVESFPSKDSLLKMAQTEAYRQMGGGMMGQARMATDPKFKQSYLDLVTNLYNSYVSKFRGEEIGGQENIDTGETIDSEYEEYLKSEGNI